MALFWLGTPDSCWVLPLTEVRKMRKFMIYILLALLVLLIIIFGIFSWVYINAYLLDSSNPLRRPTDEIRAEIIELTPIGSSLEEVIRVIDNNETWEWHRRHVSQDGFPTDAGWTTFVGEQSIRVELGRYWRPRRSFLYIHVTVFWGFDEDGTLVDVRVQKS